MDSICSAIGYAEFKRATGMDGVIAARCGNTNQRIDFALHKFGLEAPVFFADVYPRIEDVMQRNVVSIHRDAPVYQAMTRFGEDKFRGLPVVDDARNCIGLLSAFKLGKYLFPPIENLSSSRIVEASIAHIREAIRATLITGKEETAGTSRSFRSSPACQPSSSQTTFPRRIKFSLWRRNTGRLYCHRRTTRRRPRCSLARL